ncbi:hydroxyethylthiazole kinase [Pseudobacillus badius]|uniref:hydroxyethylthiazole kinase n=1 Tax=Bacillus badius TaxID=1455 RepID=UPI0007B0692D|nr:hydroxyethylthiazole kinase [Bacillus badius]KZO00669.1 hydroxyethylthiazole kinase [Bacillus badius]MED0667106.1 hydroxyethylthiazole kinase [Bacillus badius]OCS88088.1 hydroxyethylthiazole kinase [Bacillus badius]OVE53387.1 hydroxyethylthiazole kinase [Bacillus badius]TDW05743.1 hydroxyethylthiazole kinase [Bacillus badius]
MDHQTVSQLLVRVRQRSPLVHNITNNVVTNFTANGLLALGASPVMAYAQEEVAEMARMAGALVLNIGTLDAEKVAAMITAGKAANDAGVPVIFDPVGAGATAYRTEAASRIMSEVQVDVLRGNAAEVANVAGKQGNIKGVDAGESMESPIELAKEAAAKWKTTAVITGETDVIASSDSLFLVRNGHPMLTKVTGTGCLFSAVIGAFCAVEQQAGKAAASAAAVYGVAAEAAMTISGEEGPGSFQVEFLNQLAKVGAESISAFANIATFN